jgi:hypothetical protein
MSPYSSIGDNAMTRRRTVPKSLRPVDYGNVLASHAMVEHLDWYGTCADRARACAASKWVNDTNLCKSVNHRRRCEFVRKWKDLMDNSFVQNLFTGYASTAEVNRPLGPLSETVGSKLVDYVELLSDAHISRLDDDDIRDAYLISVVYGDVEITKALLKQQKVVIHPNYKNAFSFATAFGQLDTVELLYPLLLKNRSGLVDMSLSNGLWYAATRGFKLIFLYLLHQTLIIRLAQIAKTNYYVLLMTSLWSIKDRLTWHNNVDIGIPMDEWFGKTHDQKREILEKYWRAHFFECKCLFHLMLNQNNFANDAAWVAANVDDPPLSEADLANLLSLQSIVRPIADDNKALWMAWHYNHGAYVYNWFYRILDGDGDVDELRNMTAHGLPPEWSWDAPRDRAWPIFTLEDTFPSP